MKLPARAACAVLLVLEGCVTTTGAVQVASYYGAGEHLNRHTFNGEVFDPRGLTAASRDLPMGSWARVTNLANGRSVEVRINDRGPARWTGRGIDVTRAAADTLGFRRAGVAQVKIEVLK